MDQHLYFENYTPAADIVVAAICIVIMVLVAFSYIGRKRSSRLFLQIVGLVFCAACADITFYMLVTVPSYQFLANWLRCGYHALLFLIFVYYVAYICEVTHFEQHKLYITLANVMFAAVLVADIVTTAQGYTFFVDGMFIRSVRRGIFIYGYLGLTGLCVILMMRVRRLLYHRVMFGFYGTVVVSLLVLLVQGLREQTSFTVSTLLFPTIAMMYILHSNPYDAQLGSNDARTMREYVQYCHEKRRDFIVMSLYLREYDEEGKEFPLEMQTATRRFIYGQTRGGRLFKAGKGHMILIFTKDRNPDYEERIEHILETFYPLYDKFHTDYKIVIADSIDEISRRNEYVSYIRNIHRSMPECSVHRAKPEDVAGFNRTEYILEQLGDIYRKGDLDDPRVLVYCQAVLNVRTGRYDTAEALMRLKLDRIGIVFPDQFIYLAEEQGYIHMLTEIILHKTCEAIRQFTDAGYEIRRISVNISVPELKDDAFCDDIISIIDRSGIPGEKIAIELTESRNDGDFILMKKKIGELRKQGIKFYLDDFGTGYSSMERIMALPFDIIKFDRSLVIASGSEDRSRKMVANLANMFTDMDYSVLYEGVERDADEAMCMEMSATYLQGYKYSRPAPIMDLKDYLSTKAG